MRWSYCLHIVLAAGALIFNASPGLAYTDVAFGSIGKVPVTLDARFLRRVHCGKTDFSFSASIKNTDPASVKLTLRKTDTGPVHSEIVLKRSEGTQGGIKIERLFAQGAKVGNKTLDIDLMRSLEPKYAVRLYEATCPDAGWEPGSLIVAIAKDSHGRLAEWAQRAGGRISRTPYENVANIHTVDIPAGIEYTLLAELRRKDWVLDASREARPAGPEEITVDTPGDVLFKEGESQETVQRRLLAFLKEVFPLAKEIAESFGPRRGNRGMAFSYAMLLPIRDLSLGDADFNPYWIKANLEITLTKQGTMTRATSDRLILEIRDGWLPRWNFDHTRRPPQGHIADFHLSPDGPNKFKDFTVLFSILEKVGKAAQSKWNGTLYIPGR